MFRVGQKVVYVGIRHSMPLLQSIRHYLKRFSYPYTSPIRGEIYTVASVYISPVSGEVCLELVEISDGDPDIWLPGFYARAFRPLVERKTDISIFTAMLVPTKAPELA